MFPIFKRIGVLFVVAAICASSANAQDKAASGPDPAPQATSAARSNDAKSDDSLLSRWALALVPSVLGAVLGGLSGWAIAYFVRRSLDKSTLTVQQFQYYYSDDMVKVRSTAWNYLKGDYLKLPLKPLSHWYADLKDEKEEMRYSSMTQVLHFWHLISVLKKRNLINEELARDLLKRHCEEWCAALQPLLVASVGDKLDASNLVAEMAWMGIDPNTIANKASEAIAAASTSAALWWPQCASCATTGGPRARDTSAPQQL